MDKYTNSPEELNELIAARKEVCIHVWELQNKTNPRSRTAESYGQYQCSKCGLVERGIYARHNAMPPAWAHNAEAAGQLLVELIHLGWRVSQWSEGWQDLQTAIWHMEATQDDLVVHSSDRMFTITACKLWLQVDDLYES